MRHLAIFLFFALFFTSCNILTSGDKYQIVASTDGKAYRLDKSTGKVWLIKDNTMQEVSAKDFRLTIGQRYRGADGYSFTYSGKGQFAEIKSIDDEMKKYWIDK